MMVAALVICYHPDLGLLEKNIDSLIAAVDKIVLWRNSPEPWVIRNDLDEKVLYHGTGKNEYIAKAINETLQWCRDNSIDYLLTMDQDSVWIDCNLFVERALNSSIKDVAIYAPYVVGQTEEPSEDYDAETVITSGSLVDVSIALSLCGFREDYQIYWVDGEYCNWARANGYRIRVLHDCRLVQQFGHQTKTLFGFNTSNYSPTIYYYMIRNMIWMHREYSDGVSYKCMAYTLLYNVRGIVLGEKQKMKKLWMITKAVWIGITGHFSPRERIG